ncbi:MAG TPA: glycoside hydrolase family 3 N-terminal domain-containing protein [Terriglobia bacterium]|nr:glycoside hydrolase family 3 N-terminal domain-containing protein [Terriglobia bacterium]
MAIRKTILPLGIPLTILFACASFFAGPMSSEDARPDYLNLQLPVERRVADLLGRMTLEEKVAQTRSLWQQKQLIMDDRGNFSPDKAGKVLNNGIGEITRASEKKGPRENAEFNNAVQKYLAEHTRLGIPAIVHEESLHGFVAPGATSFPQAIALSSTWDPDLLQQVFGVAAAEVRARGGQQVLAPDLDVVRDPRWGRTEETYGEDPYLASRMGVAAIRGFQGTGPGIDQQHVIATAKHFAVHGQPEGGRNTAPGNYSARIIREVFLPSFEAAITEGGAMSVMPSYNEIDGVPSHANTWLLQDVLHHEWGFKGFIVSDYFAIAQLETLHHVVHNREEAARKAIAAGVDIELPDIDAYGTLVDQIKAGTIPEALLDQSVARILRAKFLLGLFENRYVDPDGAEKISNNPAHRELAKKAAREAITLLKNQNNLLPLDLNKLKTIAVIGPNAAQCHLGSYSDDPGRTVSILEGIKNKVGDKIKVAYSEGCKITMNDSTKGWNDDKVELPKPADDDAEIAEAVRAAKSADVAIVVVGGNEQTSREAWSTTHLGDRDNLDMLGKQDDLVRAVAATGTPTVVFLINGRPLSITAVAQEAPAILEGWYLGEETGTAVADVLFGDYNPAGRLPITFPRSVGDLPDYYNYKPSARLPYIFAANAPLFPFGFGLSYTSFKYADLRLSPDKISPVGKTTVSVDVTNTGARAGDEVVQMYIRDEVSSVTRPVKELKGFRRIHLDPGQTRTVEFDLSPKELSFWNQEMKRVVEPGTFDVMVGPNSVDLKTANLEVVER